MENQNQEQLQNIELTAEELEEIQGGISFYALPPGSLGTPNPDIFQLQVPRIRLRDTFPIGVPGLDVFQQLGSLNR
jgi:hypothetical protein